MCPMRNLKLLMHKVQHTTLPQVVVVITGRVSLMQSTFMLSAHLGAKAPSLFVPSDNTGAANA